MRGTRIGAALAAVGWLACAATPSPAPSPPLPGALSPAPATDVLVEGAPAPLFDLDALNPEACGIRRFSMRRFLESPPGEGHRRALVVAFVAAHCAPCLDEVPHLAALVTRFEDRAALVVVVIDEAAGDVERVRRRLVDDGGLTAPLLADASTLVARRYGARVLPLAVLVDDVGRVRRVLAGGTTAPLEALGRDLEALGAAHDLPRRSP